MNWLEKLSDPKFYLSKSCKHGHDLTGNKETVRHRNNSTCVICQKLRQESWVAKNPEKRKAAKDKYRKNSSRESEYRKENSEKIREYNIQYRRDHAEWYLSYYREYNRKRTAKKLRATAKWGSPEAISKIYRDAVEPSIKTGLNYQVDHIVPLQSNKVCGLHVESNLRIILSRENQQKGNRHWPDM